MFPSRMTLMVSLALWASSANALPHGLREAAPERRGIAAHLSFNRTVHGTRSTSIHQRSTGEGFAGLGDDADISYSVSLTFRNVTTAVDLDTGSSDLWAYTTACATVQCLQATVPAIDVSEATPVGKDVDLLYGDSTTGTHASGPIVGDTVTLAGMIVEQQFFAAVNNTNNGALLDGTSGIFGLSFPGESLVQANVVNEKFDNPTDTGDFIFSTPTNGPLLSRLAANGQMEQPMFSISLQRDTIDEGGTGLLSVGTLPPGVDNSSLTWVPVRLYTTADGGVAPPANASSETYPLRWEIALDAVYLDGKELPASTIPPATGITNPGVTALIDTGNSILRGPSDVVQKILTTVDPTFSSTSSSATVPCLTAHTLAFQIGGQMFPVDPRDFISGFAAAGDTTNCRVGSVVATDPPSLGTLFSWSLGDTFLKSTTVAFYHGNLTHPSVDPPRIGFLSTMPSNASALLEEVIEQAQSGNGTLASTSQLAPTTAPTVSSPSSAASSSGAAAASTTIATTVVPNGSGAATSGTAPTSDPSSKSSSTALSVPHSLISTVSVGLLVLFFSCIL